MAWFIRDQRFAQFAVRKTSQLLSKGGLENKIVNEKGYDVVLGDGRKVEVKLDTAIYKSGNLACEWWSNKENQTPGWAQYSDADILVYMYDFDNAYALDMQKLIKHVAENRSQYPAKPPYRGQSTSKAEVLLVPIASVGEFRLPEFEEMFNKYAVLPQREEAGQSQL